MTYIQTGPFTDGSAPGISANFLNNVETWIEAIDNSSPHQLIGATSGTVTLYQVMSGNIFKKVAIVLNNFWNNGGSTQTIAIPTPFTTGCHVRTGILNQMELRVGNTAQSLYVLTALGTGGGTVATQTNIASFSFGYCMAAIDTLGFRSGGSAAQSTLIMLEGI